MIKKLINFTKTQDDAIHGEIQKTERTYSEIVRRAIDQYLKISYDPPIIPVCDCHCIPHLPSCQYWLLNPKP